MIAANYVLVALGILGATDVLLYHSISHGIRTHDESRWELITHAMRGPTYAILFSVTPNFELHGAFAFLFVLLLLVDVGISIADFALERRSRAELGGLPSGEYVLHMMMAMLFGAFVTLALPNIFTWMGQGTAMVASHDLAPAWVRVALAIFAVGVFISGAADWKAAMHMSRKCELRFEAR